MINLTDKNFRKEVLEVDQVVLVDFWAPWCGPCRMVAPILEKIAQEKAGIVKIAKVNVDENPELSSQYNIMSIPSMLIFKKGQLVDQFVGALPQATIENKLLKWAD
jgi:thioredoxin 1